MSALMELTVYRGKHTMCGHQTRTQRTAVRSTQSRSIADLTHTGQRGGCFTRSHGVYGFFSGRGKGTLLRVRFPYTKYVLLLISYDVKCLVCSAVILSHLGQWIPQRTLLVSPRQVSCIINLLRGNKSPLGKSLVSNCTITWAGMGKLHTWLCLEYVPSPMSSSSSRVTW